MRLIDAKVVGVSSVTVYNSKEKDSRGLPKMKAKRSVLFADVNNPSETYPVTIFGDEEAEVSAKTRVFEDALCSDGDVFQLCLKREVSKRKDASGAVTGYNVEYRKVGEIEKTHGYGK